MVNQHSLACGSTRRQHLIFPLACLFLLCPGDAIAQQATVSQGLSLIQLSASDMSMIVPIHFQDTKVNLANEVVQPKLAEPLMSVDERGFVFTAQKAVSTTTWSDNRGTFKLEFPSGQVCSIGVLSSDTTSDACR